LAVQSADADRGGILRRTTPSVVEISIPSRLSHGI
jgi:hypothetical protein